MDSLKQLEHGYFVNIKGDIFNKDKVQMRPQKHTGGYLVIRLWNPDTRKHEQRYIHRIVAKVFLDNPNKYKYVNHIDGNKKNNCVENLEWCSAKDNTKHAYDNGLAKHGEKSTSSKLTQDQVNEIRSTYKKGKITYVELGKIYGISKQQIERIVNKKRWSRT